MALSSLTSGPTQDPPRGLISVESFLSGASHSLVVFPNATDSVQDSPPTLQILLDFSFWATDAVKGMFPLTEDTWKNPFSREVECTVRFSYFLSQQCFGDS